MSVLAEHPFWSMGVASRSRVSRMLDVEYVSEIYLLTDDGVLDGSPAVLDEYYADYDEEIPGDDSYPRPPTPRPSNGSADSISPAHGGPT